MIKGVIRCSVMLLVSVVLASGAAYAAEQYQTEVSAVYSRFESGADLRITTYGPGVEWFFSPVNTSEHSYAEAVHSRIVGDNRQLSGPLPCNRRNEIFRDSAQAKPAHQDGHAIPQVGYRFIGRRNPLVHGNPVYSN